MAFTNKDTALKYIRKGLHFSSPNFDNFRDDKDVVLEVIKNGGTLEFAGTNLKTDKEFYLEVIKLDEASFIWISDKLRIELGLPDLYDQLETLRLKKQLKEELPVNQVQSKKPIIKI